MAKDEATVEVEFERIEKSTSAAVLFVVPTYEQETKDVWIPKSQLVEVREEDSVMVIPEWLAINEGLA